MVVIKDAIQKSMRKEDRNPLRYCATFLALVRCSKSLGIAELAVAVFEMAAVSPDYC